MRLSRAIPGSGRNASSISVQRKQKGKKDVAASTESTPRKTNEDNSPASRNAAPRVQFDTKNLKSSYANVCTATSTREEVVLNFGINQAWERGSGDATIELTNRIILSPFAATRLLELLTKLMQEYESRYGQLRTESTNGANRTA
jgi:hypothetical protein